MLPDRVFCKWHSAFSRPNLEISNLMSPKNMVEDHREFIFSMNSEPVGGFVSLFDHKSKIFFRQSYGSRIYLRQTYPSNSLPARHFLQSVTGKMRQTYASRRGNIMGKVTLTAITICIIIQSMNETYSQPELYRKRWITPLLQEASRNHPVIVLTGARQVGKSTLLLNASPFRDWRFHTMDDFDVLEQANKNPGSLWAGTENVVLDEVQKAPDLLSAVKLSVDRNPGKYRFVLSGSANLLLMKQVSESLAGRAVYFILDPMTLGETKDEPPNNLITAVMNGNFPDEATFSEELPDPTEIMVRGLMPALLPLDSSQAWTRWWDGYVTTYLERDLRQISQIDALLDFRRLMEFVALRSGQLMNQSEIARDAQLSQPTVHRYLNLLETTHLFERVPAYTTSHTTRLLKSPKVFLNDPGLAIFLSGYFETDELRKAREYGAYFETFIYHHLRVITRLMTPSGRLYFWRTQQGAEVDFVIEHGRHILALEVKRTNNPGYRDIAGLQSFLNSHPEAVGGLLIHSGKGIRRLAEKIIAIPWVLITG
jgi:predicted AAA+ superfamily ATPase